MIGVGVWDVSAKRRLVDSQMVGAESGAESWTQWNVRQAVKSWTETQRNFGLSVQVEDEDGNLLPAHHYFAPMNCDKYPGNLNGPLPLTPK